MKIVIPHIFLLALDNTNFLATFVDDECGHRFHLHLFANWGILLAAFKFAEADLASELLRPVAEGWLDEFARTAPLGVEIHNKELVATGEGLYTVPILGQRNLWEVAATGVKRCGGWGRACQEINGKKR